MLSAADWWQILHGSSFPHDLTPHNTFIAVTWLLSLTSIITSLFLIRFHCRHTQLFSSLELYSYFCDLTWHCALLFLQKSVRARDSKFGLAMVVESSERVSAMFVQFDCIALCFELYI